MRSLLDAGVDGIITDRPDVLREVLISRGEWAPPGVGGRAAGVPRRPVFARPRLVPPGSPPGSPGKLVTAIGRSPGQNSHLMQDYPDGTQTALKGIPPRGMVEA